MKLIMKKFILYLFLSLFITSIGYADPVLTMGKCFGYLVAKIKNEGMSSLSPLNLNYIKNLDPRVAETVQKLTSDGIDNCLVQGRPISESLHCYSAYSEFEVKIHVGFQNGILDYRESRYNGKKGLLDLACTQF